MHSAIIVVQVPDNKQRWLAFKATIDHLQRDKIDPLHKKKGVEQLSKNVWLVNFQENPEPLARLVSAAIEHRFDYGILQFDDEPKWLRGAPNTTDDQGMINPDSWEGSDDD
jgi:hypothetical protein